MSNSIVNYCTSYKDALGKGAWCVLDVETERIHLEKDQTLFTHTPSFVMGQIGSVVTEDQSTFWRTSYALSSKSGGAYYIAIGHNLAYDMLYLSGLLIDDPGFMIWDTMIAEYLLTNQAERMPSLERACEVREMSMTKENIVSAHIKSGGCPSELPKNQLELYLRQDCAMTEALFKLQLQDFYRKSDAWQNMFISQMLFRINTFRASYNGMLIDQTGANACREGLELAVNSLHDVLVCEMCVLAEDTEKVISWNPASVDHVSAILYGGTLKYETQDPIGTYKTGPKAGQPKFKKIIKEFIVLPVIIPYPLVPTTGTDEAALKVFAEYTTTAVGIFAERLLTYRDMCKTLNTYLKGYLDFAVYDGYIHPQFNHALTPTGRLTCSKPNLQNIKG